MDAKQLGLFITKQRKKLNMTQADLADKIYVTSKAVSRWERGIGFPDINTLEPLAYALGVTVTELICCESDTKNYLIEDVLNIAKEEKKDNNKQLKKTLIIILLGLIITIFLHIVTFSNHESGWFICFSLAFIIAIINIFLTFYSYKHIPYLLAFFSVTCLSLGILESNMMICKWIFEQDFAALYDVVPYETTILNVMMYIIIILNLFTFIIKYKTLMIKK